MPSETMCNGAADAKTACLEKCWKGAGFQTPILFKVLYTRYFAMYNAHCVAHILGGT